MRTKNKILNRQKYAIICFTILMMVAFFSCGKKENPTKTTLVLATFSNNSEIAKQVEEFNEKNPDCQIQICEYTRSDQLSDDGIAKLKREIASGKGPDLIDFGHSYVKSDMKGDYTIDIMPYLEKQGTDQYFLNIMKAFSIDDETNIVPISFRIDSYVGRREMLQGLEHWNMNEMIQCYEGQKDDVMFYPGEMKIEILGTMISGGVDYYIDWQNGTCRFDSDEFKQMLQFCNTFPNTLELGEDENVLELFQKGKSLLYPARITSVYHVAQMETIFDEDIVYIGFPVDGISGTMIHAQGPMLAISKNSKNPDKAWEFISQCIDLESQKEIKNGFPINKQAFQMLLDQAKTEEYTTDSLGNIELVTKSEVMFEGSDAIPIYAISNEQADRILQMVETAEISSSDDRTIQNILYEESQAYFEGAKSLDEVTDTIQSRVSIYLSEQMN